MSQPDFQKLAPSQLHAERAERLAELPIFQNCQTAAETFWAELPAADTPTHRAVYFSEKQTLRCDCPFRPKPCIHALALAIFLEKNGAETFAPAAEIPEWATQLLTGQPLAPRPSALNPEQRQAARERRHFDRLEKAADGFDDLENWLHDLARRGLAAVAGESPNFTETIAARMADASLGSLSRQLRLLGQNPTLAPDWAEQTLTQLADFQLACRAFRRREQLPEALLFDLQNFIGIATKTAEVQAAGERLTDTWAVFSVREMEVENQLTSRRMWLFGAKNQRWALQQEYTHPAAGGFVAGFRPGEIWRGELVFYPSAYPLRALLAEGELLAKQVEKIPGHADFKAFATAFAEAIGLQPWLVSGVGGGFPAATPAASPFFSGKKFWLADASGNVLPLAIEEKLGWKLLALSGCQPIGVFGEWNGAEFLPLTALAGGRLVDLSAGGPGQKPTFAQ